MKGTRRMAVGWAAVMVAGAVIAAPAVGRAQGGVQGDPGERCLATSELPRFRGLDHPLMAELRSRIGEEPGMRVRVVGGPELAARDVASALASSISAVMYTVDLTPSSIQYLEETESNLSRILERAGTRDVVLLVEDRDAVLDRRTAGRGAGAGERLARIVERVRDYDGVVVVADGAVGREIAGRSEVVVRIADRCGAPGR